MGIELWSFGAGMAVALIFGGIFLQHGIGGRVLEWLVKQHKITAIYDEEIATALKRAEARITRGRLR